MASGTLCRLAAIAAIGLLAAAPKQQNGQFALFGGKSEVTSVLTRVGAGEVDLAQYRPGSKSPLRRYVPSYGGETMHFVLVRDDFTTFFHVHPQMQSDGHFRTSITLQPGHRFYAFASSTPFEMRQQVFRFVLQASAPRHQVTTVAARNRGVMAGPFHVAISTAALPVNRPSTLAVTLSRDGARTRVPMEMTIIGVSNLEYLHPSANAQGVFALPAMPAGFYRAWVQLRQGTATYTAPFTIASR